METGAGRIAHLTIREATEGFSGWRLGKIEIYLRTGGANYLRLLSHREIMYPVSSCPLGGVYADSRHAGRYAVAAGGCFQGDVDATFAALEALGYELVDADQWGASYRHREDRSRRVELDEWRDESGRVYLRLADEDLTLPEAQATGAGLQGVYRGLLAEIDALGPGACCPYLRAGDIPEGEGAECREVGCRLYLDPAEIRGYDALPYDLSRR
jgi:hypothetical protein